MKLSIPKPCNEDWNNMLPQENGRFCKSCEKVVIDFSDILDAEIEKYFIENLGKSVCGRFKKSQIYRITIQIPVSEIQNIRPRNYFLIALLFAFGSTLFSCTDNEGNTAKIDKIEIIDTSGKVNPNIDTIAKIDSTLKVRKVVPEVAPEIEIEVNKTPLKKSDYIICILPEEWFGRSDSSNVYLLPPEIPVFAGGADSLKKFLAENLKYPPLTSIPLIRGEVMVSAIVQPNGKLTDVTVEKSLHPALDSEAVRVVKLMPNWIPANDNGNIVKRKVFVPVKF